MIRKATLTIESGETVSDEIAAWINKCMPRYLLVPIAFTGTSIGIEVTFDGENWYTLEDNGGDSSPAAITVAAGRSKPSLIPLNPLELYGLKWLRIVSSSAEADDREVGIVFA